MHNCAFCWLDNLKIVDVQQTKMINKFNNSGQNLLKTNVAIGSAISAGYIS
jgi:hypothetical protein